VRRPAIIASALVLVLAAAGCGGGSSSNSSGSAKGSQSHTVVDVSKAFYDAGIAFTSQQTFNPYVNGQTVFLPGKLNTSSLRNTIEAGLSQTGAFDGAVAWVFDTDASAAAALKVVPLSKWLSGDPPIVRVHDGNVIIVASGFKGAEAKKLQTALASLKG
jgi:ABC-type glycerol-3-phosphate transport system substrate-binding protein